MTKVSCKIPVVLGVLLCLALPMRLPADDALVFGFLPILSPQKLVARFGPLTDYLAKALGRPVRLETAANYAEFVRRTNDRRYDILFTAPHFYYIAQRQAGFRVLVRVDAPSMPAVIVTRKDSNIETLDDLRGKKLSTVDPIALGTALVKAHLSAHGIDPQKDLTLVATPTHNASLLSAYKRVTDAASLMMPPYSRAKPEVKNNMKIIAQTAGTPHMPISVSASVSEQDAAIISNALLNLKSSEEGKALLKHLSWPGFAKATPAEYDQLEWAAKQINLTE
ncbi:MAG: phosphate/phosphite/phosphonate ABC transporter substrate-binding protein [Gammaproteobacteria bacterium]|nr:phosphate/phosphite/phosphonate ABC transporter substrate-binding protein [Gammaproteobacteria bacterium]